jgi:hypothetical protein
MPLSFSDGGFFSFLYVRNDRNRSDFISFKLTWTDFVVVSANIGYVYRITIKVFYYLITSGISS